MCPGLCATRVEYSPRILGGGMSIHICFPFLVLRNCSRHLVYTSGGGHWLVLVSRCYCFARQGLLALVAEGRIFFFFLA